jgi:hypothetical protein
MSGNISFNPSITTVAAGTFGVQWQGLIQGTAMPDPSARNALAGGVLAGTETLPLWGGVGLSEFLSTAPLLAAGALGGNLKRATSLTGTVAALTGFSVFDQNHSAINTPQSPVPLVAAGMTATFYRLGSGARIAVAMDPVLTSFEGDIITQPVSWDFSLQRLIPYVAAYNANLIASAAWSGGVVTLTTFSAHGLSVGSVFTISGFTPDGYNGTFTAIAGTTGSTLKYALAADPGVDLVAGRLDAGGGALNVRVLDVQVGNSMVVSYDPDTGFATWDRSGSAALILI